MLRTPNWQTWLVSAAGLCALAGIASATGSARRHSDLIVTVLSRPPASAQPGERFTVTVSTKNRGSVRTRRSRTRLYLSRNATKGPGDLLLGSSQAVPRLQPGHVARARLHESVPRSIRTGRWLLLACADDMTASS